jgi:hypothetical protein
MCELILLAFRLIKYKYNENGIVCDVFKNMWVKSETLLVALPQAKPRPPGTKLSAETAILVECS